MKAYTVLSVCCMFRIKQAHMKPQNAMGKHSLEILRCCIFDFELNFWPLNIQKPDIGTLFMTQAVTGHS